MGRKEQKSIIRRTLSVCLCLSLSVSVCLCLSVSLSLSHALTHTSHGIPNPSPTYATDPSVPTHSLQTAFLCLGQASPYSRYRANTLPCLVRFNLLIAKNSVAFRCLFLHTTGWRPAARARRGPKYLITYKRVGGQGIGLCEGYGECTGPMWRRRYVGIGLVLGV